MNRVVLLIFYFTTLCASLFGQTVEIPSLALSGISFELKGEGFADTLKFFEIQFIKDGSTDNFKINLSEGSFDTSLTIHNSGNYKIVFSGIKKGETTLNVIPGILSIIPPLLAIALALI
ncbi:MAG: hypothetical protein MUE64_04210, partial [Ignavibacteriaceae bacterium]|nr:hypothetical protein [Ignavibacteriaceae bacterium]